MTADITGLLNAWSRGDEAALDGLMSAMYPELRRIARTHLSGRQRGQTLESAALANEAYLKLIRAGSLEVENRVHFLAYARGSSGRFWSIMRAAGATPSAVAA
jgi:hypothetical protein